MQILELVTAIRKVNTFNTWCDPDPEGFLEFGLTQLGALN